MERNQTILYDSKGDSKPISFCTNTCQLTLYAIERSPSNDEYPTQSMLMLSHWTLNIFHRDLSKKLIARDQKHFERDNIHTSQL